MSRDFFGADRRIVKIREARPAAEHFDVLLAKPELLGIMKPVFSSKGILSILVSIHN